MYRDVSPSVHIAAYLFPIIISLTEDERVNPTRWGSTLHEEVWRIRGYNKMSAAASSHGFEGEGCLIFSWNSHSCNYMKFHCDSVLCTWICPSSYHQCFSLSSSHDTSTSAVFVIALVVPNTPRTTSDSVTRPKISTGC